MSWQAMVPSFALLPVSVSAAAIAGAGASGICAVCVLTSALIVYSARLALQKSNVAARQLLTASIIYLPLTYLVLILTRS